MSKENKKTEVKNLFEDMNTHEHDNDSYEKMVKEQEQELKDLED